MRKVKMFYACNIDAMEEKINDWLKENESFKITDKLQSYYGGNIIISIWYNTSPIS
jgi:hypothetical protein